MLVVICRSAKEPRTNANWLLGWNCAVCDEALQVGPQGRAAITAGGKPFCTKCGMEFMHSVPPEERAGVMFSPEGLKTLERYIEKARNAGKN